MGGNTWQNSGARMLYIDICGGYMGVFMCKIQWILQLEFVHLCVFYIIKWIKNYFWTN